MWFSNPPASDQLNRCGSRRTLPNPVVSANPPRNLAARSILETAPRGAVPGSAPHRLCGRWRVQFSKRALDRHWQWCRHFCRRVRPCLQDSRRRRAGLGCAHAFSVQVGNGRQLELGRFDALLREQLYAALDRFADVDSWFVCHGCYQVNVTSRCNALSTT